MTRRFMAGFVGRRVLPWLTLLVLIALAYLAYSWHTTTDGDWRDELITGGVAAACAALVVYFVLRTATPTPQVVGIVGFLIGDAVLYGSLFANFRGWTQISQERRGDALRASVTVAVLVTVGGVLFYEWVQWRDRKRTRPVPSPGDPVVYERRRLTDRRKGWGKLPDTKDEP